MLPRLTGKPVLKGLVILNIMLLIIWFQGSKINPKPALSLNTPVYPELQELEGKNLSFDELKKYFTALADSKGAKYAYEVLKIAPIPPNTDMHLLGHFVGDVLYKQQGLNGIKVCTEDFRNACSHSIVVGLLLDKGDSALTEISAACKQAPGGSGAYTMCYHGLGHGVLAYANYDLPEAIELCQKTSTQKYGKEESIQCVGGTIMEIISGGGHDKQLWNKQRHLYLESGNPLKPCFSEYLPIEARQMCLTYLTPYLWEAAGANLDNPTDADFQTSFKFCDQITEPMDRNACFGGFGKEFVVLAQKRDIRKIESMSNDQFLKVVNLCKLADDIKGISACLSQALSSIFWGGENDVSASIRFCNVISDAENQKDCFQNLIGQVSNYIKDSSYRESFCNKLPVEFKGECKKKLISTS